jgi:CelD/BcsL family acetyltransferase involved in cellulose biosynthesis
MSLAAPLPLRFQVGARTLFAVKRRLVRIGLSLDRALAAETPHLPPLDPADHGYLLTSVPAAKADGLRRQDMLALERPHYARRYADLSGSFEAYLAGFSGKTRSTLRRKLRKFETLSGDALDVRAYRTADEVAEFHALARAVSRKTYQEKLLDAGLPSGAEAEAEMRRKAALGEIRAWLLFLEGDPVAYLYTPAEGDTLIYAYLGYDPALAKHSPGTVLQLAAMRQLMEEGCFRRFDFTEGDGQHKRQFATGSIDCVDLLLLRKSPGNRLLLASLRGFERLAAFAKGLGLGRMARRIGR